jgi:elongation factor P
MYSMSDIRKGLKIEVDGEPYIIVEFQHVKPGKGGGFTRTKIKSVLTGNVLERTFRSGEKITRPDLEEKNMQFLYKDEDSYHFMDNDTYEQVVIEKDIIGNNINYLKENLDARVLFFQGKPVGTEVATFVELLIAKTDPGLKGDTATGATKPATCETGLVVQVPLFLNEGDVIKIDTRTGSYIERVQT